jgi:hypothetical protein
LSRVNGQIQYGSARPLTLQRTRVIRVPPKADPARFPPTHGASRPVILLFGASLLLGAVLTATPRNVPGVAVAVVLGGIWLSLVLAMTLPREPERAGQEMVRRLAQFRHELHAMGDIPSRAALDRLLLRARELGLRDEEIAEELAQIRACADALDLQAQLARGEMPIVDPPDPLAPGDDCHFVAPVRFGRRRSDQFGHLVLTGGWLKFRGALDISVAWSEVSSVRRDGREILVGLQDSRRVFRFSCQSLAEAANGGVIAGHFSQAARAGIDPSPQYHAPM